MTVTAAFCPLSLQPLRDQNDARVFGGKVFFYAAGTTTLISTFADAGLATANPNPLPVDGFARIPPAYIGAGAYRVVAQDGSGAQLFAVDSLPGGVDYDAKAKDAAAAAGSTISAPQTGDIKARMSQLVIAGWVRANGQTIGSASSQATERASDDTRDLFISLWNELPDSLAPVSGGRGATASADFAGAKTIGLPDLRGRVLVGADEMGAPNFSSVLTLDAVANPNQVGYAFGSETQTLSVAQLPAFTPNVTIDKGVAQPGQHTHSGSTGAAGGHNHDITDPGHVHSYLRSGVSNYGAQSGGNPNVNTGDGSTNTQSSLTGIKLGAVGDHTHPVTIDGGGQGGSHTHTAVADAIGSGRPHDNLQPSTIVFWHIKL